MVLLPQCSIWTVQAPAVRSKLQQVLKGKTVCYNSKYISPDSCSYTANVHRVTKHINTYKESKPVTLTDLSEHVIGVNEVVKVLKETDASQYWKVPGKEYSSGNVCKPRHKPLGKSWSPTFPPGNLLQQLVVSSDTGLGRRCSQNIWNSHRCKIHSVALHCPQSSPECKMAARNVNTGCSSSIAKCSS